MLGFLKKILGTKSEKDVKEIQPIVDKVNTIYSTLSSLSNDQLRQRTADLKQKIKDTYKTEDEKIAAIRTRIEAETEMNVDQKEDLYKEIDEIEKAITKKIEAALNDAQAEAFAICKETARRFTENKELRVKAGVIDEFYIKRHPKNQNVAIENGEAVWQNTWLAAANEVVWNMVHYDVQLIGGAVLHSGKISEMATGEGKTLVATLPIFLNALSGRGVHVVTVNTYLSRRDSEWNAPLFEFHGLTVDCLDKHEPNSYERRMAYLADITYGTNNEFGFDYLRDNMARSPEELVQRKHNYAIVDEVDSVLIDDARTPLIISGPTPKGDKHEFVELKPRVEKLVGVQRQYLQTCLADAKKLVAEGKEKEAGIPLLRCYRGLPKNTALIKFLSETGVRALLQKTENFYMQDQQKEMHKIDQELYFVIDEKHNSVELTEKGIDLITTNSEDQKFFVMPNVGDEIAEIEKSGAPAEEKLRRKEVLIQDFSVKSERIHTVNQLLKAYTVFEKDVEYVIEGGQIKIVDEQTGRIMEGRRYSDGLHQAIEAKESVKIEAATQTYATITLQNYFRMYNKLAGMTGTASTESQEFWDIYKLDVVEIPTNRNIQRKDEEDLVYKTTREKYNAVIEEVTKLVAAGRPVLVGTTSVEISELLSRMLKLKGIRHNVLNAKLHQKEAEVVAEAGLAGTVTIATNMAGRGTDIKLGPGVKDAGGLAIIGTERHESRRVDRQLRGRAGRQGDPGSSQFFVSLEDNLMRLFGSERIAKMMDRMGLKEGEVIQHSMITKSIERAQKKVEENNFGIRKRLIEYDDVMNAQRDVVYKRRKNGLFGERLSIDIANMIYDISESVVSEFHEARDFESFQFELLKSLAIESPVSAQEFNSIKHDDLVQRVFDAAEINYKAKNQRIAATVLPVVTDVYKNESNTFENIVTPISDGIHTIQVLANLKKAYDTQGKELVLAFEKMVTLIMIDDAWKEHLRELDDLKQSVQNASLEQKDPLLIYKLESFKLFKDMILKTSKDTISFLIKGNLPAQNSEQAAQQARFSQAPQQKPKEPQYTETRSEEEVQRKEKPKAVPIKAEAKTGRNDPCPCGSGKKYKNCHGQ
ncbi:MAG: preprotein translocase, SecA subunit [Bacteroidetes bacterium]|jgi:preprotein translocase subunit SecA|nr:preprotein translocase, SecA subunit [Bacteroidota bacterium]